jgi:diguanylate cyclase (GGDEF)-like protein
MVLQRDDSLAADWLNIYELSTTGRLEQALERAEQLVAEASNTFQAAQALIARAILLYNSGDRVELLPLLQPIQEKLNDAPHPRLTGQFHLLLARVAYDRRSYGVALFNIAAAQRALEQMSERTRAAVYAWSDLAMIYSQLGYHTEALQAVRQTQSLADDTGRATHISTAAIASVHAAVYLDQRGDTGGCVRHLTDLAEYLLPYIDELALVDRVSLGYAVRRLAALDRRIDVDVPAVREVGPLLSQLTMLGDVCVALAARRPDHAIALLDSPGTPLDVLGAAEPLRLRSLAQAQLRDHSGAHETDRAVLRITSQEERQLRTLLVDSIHVRIDQDKLRQTAERHARAALTDQLTGLPNRRKLDEFTAALTASRTKATIGMLDLDRFKAVNDTHGHPTGDVVLRRVAGILAREVEPTDLPVRTGGDEFVIVLPRASMGDAVTLGQRIEAAVRNEDWSSVVPDFPIAVSTGWAELDTDVDGAFRAADQALYETKREHHSNPGA